MCAHSYTHRPCDCTIQSYCDWVTNNLLLNLISLTGIHSMRVGYCCPFGKALFAHMNSVSPVAWAVKSLTLKSLASVNSLLTSLIDPDRSINEEM